MYIYPYFHHIPINPFNQPGWHNWLARETFNLKAQGSSPWSGGFFFAVFLASANVMRVWTKKAGDALCGGYIMESVRCSW
ncbi:hypothetical protein P153DRAFT_212521 [Dothidotthia symphoricarpi CBS 119687]|uniref:Uncharacterized protein n=1 Tax=Dothidotthia symphoricarpi CBS 119687 TaxID=1392245 RepID=A0A6A6AJA0_9PLEO|nr:uncharacterized protein P153DRAFT_212521 [Dothidotthia symphoricarpi CBS 119687]KAF2131178.1 hypothetical protein P153DRAFT_212521 [Dothidotthia symphoricarpi CBS 119687]